MILVGLNVNNNNNINKIAKLRISNMKSTISAAVIVLILLYSGICTANTKIFIPEMSFQCNYSNCNIGSGRYSCQVTDSNGGLVTINGVSKGQCSKFMKKTIKWVSGKKEMQGRIVKSKEISR